MSSAQTNDDASKSRGPVQVDTLTEAAAMFWKGTTPWIIGTSMTLAWAVRLYWGRWSWWDLCMAVAVVGLWPILEWLIHVVILHFKPKEWFGIDIDMHVAHKHRLHHQDPWRIEHVWIPVRTLIASLAIGPPTFLAFWSLALPPSIGLTGLATFLTFALVYEWTHFLVHTGYRPRSGWYRRLWRHHRLHHFKNEHYWYGVSRTSGDSMLGSNPDPDEVEHSETCRNITGAERANSQS
jgi:hypothetical protein